MSRVIDYGMVRDVELVDVRAHGSSGSDHRLVVFVVRPLGVRAAGRTFRIGLWNMQRDREIAPAAAVAHRLVRLLELDALLLVECGDYLEQLRQDPGAQLVVIPGRGQSNTAALVRRGVGISSVFGPRMTREGWVTVRGGRTPPKYLTTLVLDGKLRVAVGHWPPSVHPRRRRPRILVGPLARVAAYVGHSVRAVQFARRHRALPLLLAADWNNPPTSPARYGPRWVARQAGLRIVAPERGTHA